MRNNSRARVVRVAVGALLFAGTIAATAPTPPARAEGGGFHLPSTTETDKTIDFSIAGAEVHQVAGAPEGTYDGTVTGDQVTISGNGTFSMGDGLVTYLSMSVSLSSDDGASASFHWPEAGGAETVYGPLSWNQGFSVTIPVVRGATRSVSFSVEVRNCGDWVCGGISGSGTLVGWTPLCPEAATFFGAGVKFATGNVRTSYDALLAQLTTAIDQWEAETGTKASMSVGGEPIAAGLWLFSNAGVHQADYVKRFGFGPDPDSRSGKKVLEDVQDAMQSGDFWDGTYQPFSGSEADLAQSIVLQSAAQARKLNPGDVYRLALSKTGGDTRKAALLAHNTLKSLAREGTIWQTGLLPTPDFFSRYLTTIREGDNAGVWYHTFGTMYFQLEVAQSVSVSSRIVSAAGVGAAGVLYVPSWLFTNASEYFLGWEKPFRFQQMLEGVINGALSPDPTGWSHFSHGGEQAFREIFDRRDPDPEKYCFNLWGTQLAEAIRNRVFPVSPIQIFDSTRTNPFSNNAGDTTSLDPANPSGRPDLGPWDPTQPLPKLEFFNAPVDAVLEAGGVKLVLDQREGILVATGDFPYPVFPYETPDGDWALWWVVPAGLADPTVTYTALADGPLHHAVLDPAGGSIQTWVVDVEEGEEATWAPSAAAPDSAEEDVDAAVPALGQMRVGRETVEPSVLVVEFDDDDFVLVDASGTSRWFVVGGALLTAAGVVLCSVLLARRRREMGGTS